MQNAAIQDALANIIGLGKKYHDEFMGGTLVPEGMRMTQDMMGQMLKSAPNLWDLYDNLDESVITQYLPKPGTPISARTRQHLQGYERDRADKLGTLRPNDTDYLYNRYQFTGTPTFPTLMSEAGHHGWMLGQRGMYHDPSTGQSDYTLYAKNAMRNLYENTLLAGGASPDIGMSMPFDLSNISNDNSWYPELQRMQARGEVPTWNVQQKMLAEEQRLRAQAAKNEETAPSDKSDVEAFLASLALSYDSPEDFQEDLMKHYEEIVQAIGEPGFSRLHDTVVKWIQGLEAQQTNPRWQFWKRQTRTEPRPARPRMDLIGEFINQARKDGAWR